MATSVKPPSADGGNEKQLVLFKLIQALLRIRDRSLMKPDEPVYSIMQVPLLMTNSLNVLHEDDFLKDNVDISTFTPDDDILLKLEDRFMVFDTHGN